MIRMRIRSDTPGPGLPEAVAWTIGFGLAQVIAAAGCIVLLLLAAFGGWPDDQDLAIRVLLEIKLDTSFLLTGVTSLGALFLIVPAVKLRLRRDFRQRLQLRPPPVRSLVLAAGALIPLAVISNALYGVLLDEWNALAGQHPVLAQLSQANALDMLARQARTETFGVLLVALALGPALGEEIVFRGLIGNGLVRRWGTVVGVLLTSVLFSGVHGFPPHALATLPLALFLHFAYLHTRSLWVPIILHACNNALSVAMLKLPIVQEFPQSPALILSAVLYIAVVCVWLHAAGPASGAINSAELRRDVCGFQLGRALAGTCILGFTTTFVWSVLAASS
jgi:membrane protease YdiL (CAAX protease family)